MDGVVQWVNLLKDRPGENGKTYLKRWYLLIMNYANRQLSHHGDKSAAIAGLVNRFVESTGYRYFAGLWIEDLSNGLLWEASARGVTRDAGSAASWSWLSTQGSIKGYTHTDCRSLVTFVDAEEQWEGTPLVTPLKVARLTVEGLLFQARLGNRSSTQVTRMALFDMSESTEILGEAFLDSELDDASEHSPIFCLLIRDDDMDKEFTALVLVSDADESRLNHVDTFRRIGIAVVWKVSKFSTGNMLANPGRSILEKTSQSTVILV